MVLPPALFNTFVTDIDRRIERALSNPGNNTKLRAAADALQGGDATPRGLDRLEN